MKKPGAFVFAIVTLAAFTGLRPALAEGTQPQQIQAVDAPDTPLTPDNLAKALACQSRNAYRAFRLSLSTHFASIPWMEGYFAEESNGMLGVHAYRLQASIPFFGRAIGSVYFTDDGVVASLPREDALRWIAENRLEQLPAKLTQQYYRVADAGEVVAFTAFEPEQAALSALLDAKLKLPHEPAPQPATIFVGCAYTRLSPEQYLERARHADKKMEAQADIYAQIARAKKAGQ